MQLEFTLDRPQPLPELSRPQQVRSQQQRIITAPACRRKRFQSSWSQVTHKVALSLQEQAQSQAAASRMALPVGAPQLPAVVGVPWGCSAGSSELDLSQLWISDRQHHTVSLADLGGWMSPSTSSSSAQSDFAALPHVVSNPATTSFAGAVLKVCLPVTRADSTACSQLIRIPAHYWLCRGRPAVFRQQVVGGRVVPGAEPQQGHNQEACSGSALPTGDLIDGVQGGRCCSSMPTKPV